MAISLINKLCEAPLVFVDVETTGASADYGDRVIEIALLRVENTQIVAILDQLIDPQRRISPGVSILTGITQAMVDGQPVFCDVLPRVIELMSDAVVVGHNVRFDLSFLNHEFGRARVSMSEMLGRAHVIDTLRLARRRFGRGGNGLQKLARRLGFPAEVAHRAMADVHTTHRLLEHLLQPAGGYNCDLCDLIQQQGGPMGLLAAYPRESLLPLELAEALEQGGRVRMEYLDGDEQRTERVIEPLRIRRRNGEMELVAHCHLRNERRNFKLERIVQLTRVEEEPQVPPSQVEPQPLLF